MYHEFIYFIVGGNLGCSQFSVTINNVAMNVAYVFWLICAYVELLGH